MIKTRKQFEERLNKMKKFEAWHTGEDYTEEKGYNKAIDEVLKLIADEGGCFKE